MTTAAPFFPLYLKDWLMDTRGFTHEDKGVLVDLLCVAWERGGLPTQPEVVRKLANCTPQEWRRVWPTVQAGWIERDGLFIYPKLEVARQRMVERSALAKAKAAKRWRGSTSSHGADATADATADAGADAGADATASRQHTSRHRVSNAKQEAREDLPPNPPSLAVARAASKDDPHTPTALRFPTVGGEASWALTEAQVAAWVELFPSLDVRAECRGALAWVLANPSRRKTARGMPAFLVAWLSRSNDRRPSSAPALGRADGPPPPPPADDVLRKLGLLA